MKKLSVATIPICVILLLLEFYLCCQTIFLKQKESSLLILTLHFLWLSTPVLFLFFTLRLIRVRPLLAFTLTSIILISLTLISNQKAAVTHEPLGFNEIFAGYNLVVALRYMPSISYLFIVIVALLFFILYWFEKKKAGKEPFRYYNLIILVLLAPFTFYIYLQNYVLNDTIYQKKLVKLTEKYGIKYLPSSWSGNVFLHGLPMHLVQTSARGALPKYSKTDKQNYLDYSAPKTLKADVPKTIIYVLCESCWYDKQNFREIYQPLFKLGFAESRATSPVFGAGTSNSEFEMLTGLPSVTSHLSGLIYQEYADNFKQNSDTLPRFLRDHGYITYTGHNDIPDFYHRDKIYPKFGINEYQSINDMGPLPEKYAKERKPWQWAADDYLVFNTAIKRLKAAKNSKIFMHLLTMNTHGAYHVDNDDGSNAYKFQLQQSISRMSDFFKQVQAIDPNALIVIYGDHKPSLKEYFETHHILTSDDLDKGPAYYGDVPILIKTTAKDKLQTLIEASNHKPFYCLTNAIDSVFIGARPYSFKFMEEKGCLTPGPYNYQTLSKSAPNSLYALSLFH